MKWPPACSCWCLSCQTPHNIPSQEKKKNRNESLPGYLPHGKAPSQMILPCSRMCWTWHNDFWQVYTQKELNERDSHVIKIRAILCTAYGMWGSIHLRLPCCFMCSVNDVGSHFQFCLHISHRFCLHYSSKSVICAKEILCAKRIQPLKKALALTILIHVWLNQKKK